MGYKPPKVKVDSKSAGNLGTNAADYGTLGGYSTARKGTNEDSGGADGEGFSAFGMGGKSGALGKHDVLGKALDNANPWLQSDKKAKAAKAEAEARADALYKQTGILNQTLNGADTKYLDTYNDEKSRYLGEASGLLSQYQTKINDLSAQATNQASDATDTYTNTILPELKNVMGTAKTNASQAMSLEQAGDPNNPVMKAVRDLYNKQGQQARLQGQQDFGVLSALGAQSAQGQFGAAGNPMTAGQMGQIYAANQGQAGNAYAKAQQRMYDLQQQGIDKGFDQSNQIYQFGQQAQDRYGNSIKDIQNSQDQYYDSQGKFRGELGGYAGDLFGAGAAYNTDQMNMNMMGSDIAKGNAYAGTGREQNALNQKYGAQQQAANNDLAASTANNASKGQFISSMASLGAGSFGGAAGSAGAGMIRQKQPSGDSGYMDSSSGYGGGGYDNTTDWNDPRSRGNAPAASYYGRTA